MLMTLSFNYFIILFTTYLPFIVYLPSIILLTFHYFLFSFTAYIYRLMFYLLLSPLSEDQTMAVSSEQNRRRTKVKNEGEDTTCITFLTIYIL